MAAKRKVAFPRRGEVYLVNFDPTVGAEIRKTRPALIVQNDTGNRFSDTTIIAAMSSRTGFATRKSSSAELFACQR